MLLRIIIRRQCGLSVLFVLQRIPIRFLEKCRHHGSQRTSREAHIWPRSLENQVRIGHVNLCELVSFFLRSCPFRAKKRPVSRTANVADNLAEGEEGGRKVRRKDKNSVELQLLSQLLCSLAQSLTHHCHEHGHLFFVAAEID